jgi:hypothetical protein
MAGRSRVVGQPGVRVRDLELLLRLLVQDRPGPRPPPRRRDLHGDVVERPWTIIEAQPRRSALRALRVSDDVSK